jgi:hypothetical protein
MDFWDFYHSTNMGASSPKALATINDMLVHLIYCKSNACNGVGYNLTTM